MDLMAQTASTGDFAFSSSVRADVWHPQNDPKAYEWWYFDALADGGREAVVIMFLDNFIYSPRYNREAGNTGRFPAVSFTYFRDGKPLYRCINEYTEAEFHASRDIPECTIGDSSFKFRYGCIRVRILGVDPDEIVGRATARGELRVVIDRVGFLSRAVLLS
jgi:hypothetical protein